MNWLAWRQHRKQFLIIGMFLLVFTAVTIPTGLHFWHTYQHALTTCKTTNTCDQLQGELFPSQIDQLLFHFIPFIVLILPIVLGLFWGVPFLSREYTDGTNKLVWTQSVSRRKWLTVKFIWVLLGAAILTAAFTAIDTWWFKTSNALNQNRFSSSFSVQDIVPVAYSIFAVSLGIMFGAWFKRTMVALGVTLLFLIAIMLVLVPNVLRPHYEATVNYKVSLLAGPNGPQASPVSSITGAGLTVSHNPVNSNGQPLDFSNPPEQCIVTGSSLGGVGANGRHAVIAAKNQDPLISENGGPTVSVDCLSKQGYMMETKYQPSYRYWDFQRIETGLYLALSVLPIGATYWLVLKRDA